MKFKFLSFFLIIITTISLSTFGIRQVSAVNLDDCQQDNIPADKANDCIDLLNNKLGDLGNQKKTLANQIAQFNSQIQVTQLKISDAQATITKLEKEIGTLSFRIDYINSSVDQLEKLLKQRIVATYEQGFVSNLELVATSQDFSDFLLRLEYIRQVQENDKRVLVNLQQTKSNYANQKDDRQAKEAAIAESKKKLEGLKASLDQEKTSKQILLTATQNDETKYQRLLAQAQAELAITFGGGSETKLRDIKQGDTIGTVISGASGCSTGTHLHFEVHKNNSVDDPNNYLSSQSFSYPYGESDTGSINPHGSWSWPISGSIKIYQGYGMTPYARSGAYGGRPHYGIDMLGDSLSVKAVGDGELYGGSYSCYNGSLYYARVKQSDGVDVLYLHMIPH